MSVSLIVTTYNWKEALTLCLASVRAQTRLPDEVIIADDGSHPDTRETIAAIARDYPLPLRHIWQEDHGFRAARSRNRGIAASRGDYVILIDGDMLLHPRFIADHLRFAGRGHCLQGGRLLATPAETTRLLSGGRARFDVFVPSQSRRHQALRLPWLARFKLRASYGGKIMSCNMSFWRDDLLRVNGFDERMQGYGSEDIELCARLAHDGVVRRQLKFAAIAVHLHHTTRAPPDPLDASLPNNRILAETQRSRTTRCAHGIADHQAEFAQAAADAASR